MFINIIRVVLESLQNISKKKLQEMFFIIVIIIMIFTEITLYFTRLVGYSIHKLTIKRFFYK